MSAPAPYLLFPGTATEALEHYRSVFGGELSLHTYEELGRHDGPGDAIAHGELSGAVTLFGADAGADEDAVQMIGVSFSLLGAADADVLKTWFAALAEGGRVVDPLQRRPWGDHDGTVMDRYGVRWLIGYRG
ncbi:PhnB protein [Microbacterium resistens]|uniref:PhnB protein n=1 Tax=Microbacterium resistens TaxID=156977 RepID=A0ABU1SET6_9MICO|nr:VOC family protein [Microbacterium resistens]MDR6868115.1 PhnB protein [Microbacterium resistens]